MKPTALEELVKRHGKGWRLLAAQWACDPDDCVQEALLRLVRQPKPPRHPAAWVFRVVRNLATNQQRQRKTRVKHQAQLNVIRSVWTEPDPALTLQLHELQNALQRLDDDRRTAIVSRIWGELTFAEIGNCLACSTAKAHRLYRSGLDELGQALESQPNPAELTEKTH